MVGPWRGVVTGPHSECYLVNRYNHSSKGRRHDIMEVGHDIVRVGHDIMEWGMTSWWWGMTSRGRRHHIMRVGFASLGGT